MTVPSPWINWSESQHVDAARVVRPSSLEELREVVLDVRARGERLKPVATGLSFSDILQSRGTLVEMTGLVGQPETGALLPLEEELFREPPRGPLVRVAAGARIRWINQALAAAGLAFSNLGGYDGQTFVGAASTSTHGSGLRLPPLGDGVVSLDLLTAEGQLWRLEPHAGPTDDVKFKKRYGDSRRLVQDDDQFWSVVVSLGCMGLIHSMVVRVSPAYRLLERRKILPWCEVKRQLTGQVLRRFRNYEVLINPYERRDDDFTCLVTERSVAPPDYPSVPLPAARRSAESITFLATSQSAIVRLMNAQPRLIPGILELGLEQLKTGQNHHIDDSYRVYNVGKINTARVLSGEYFFPLRGEHYLRGIHGLLDQVALNQRRGLHQPAPLSLRFVAASRAPLSMAFGEPYCAVEVAAFSESIGSTEVLLSYEKRCLELGGRPHWGQLHELTGRAGWVKGAYPALDKWLSTRRALDPDGVFNNHFTDRLGLS